MRSRILKPLVVSLVLAAGGAVATPAWAGSASADLLVTAIVIPSCVISATPVAFGVYDPIVTNSASDVDNSGTVTIACTKGSNQTITLDQGSNPDEALLLRKMREVLEARHGIQANAADSTC